METTTQKKRFEELKKTIWQDCNDYLSDHITYLLENENLTENQKDKLRIEANG